MRSSGLWGVPINDDDDDWGLDEFGYRRERDREIERANQYKETI